MHFNSMLRQMWFYLKQALDLVKTFECKQFCRNNYSLRGFLQF